MSRFKSFSKRLADQIRAKENLVERTRKIAACHNRDKLPPAKQSTLRPCENAGTDSADECTRTQGKIGNAPFKYSARTTNEQIWPQPWTSDLVSTLLKAAGRGVVTLCLVWPAKLNSLPLLHALANMERVFAKDLRGIRTLLYPGTHNTARAALHGVLVDRMHLCKFYLSMWEKQASGNTELIANTFSPAFQAALNALNDVCISHPELPNPSFAELIPTFVFDPANRCWATTVANPLERTLSKVERLAERQDLRQQVYSEWHIPNKAPCALMVLHHTTKKDAWRAALTALALKGSSRPEGLLLDATHAATQTNYAAVKRIPDFLQFAYGNGFSDVGAVIVTDDPNAFFMLRAQLYKLKFATVTKVWAAEADDVLLSSNPVSSDWKPEQRSNSSLSIGIVDRDASQLALTLQRLADSIGTEESLAHQTLIDTSLYVLRLSNMPAGYSDLTAAATETGGSNFANQLNAWTPRKLALQDALDSGVLNNVRAEVEKTIHGTERFIDDWNDATPMASRLLAEVRKYTVTGRQKTSIVLPNNKYALLALRFLQRKLSTEWLAVETLLEWHTLSSVTKKLTGNHKGKHFVFIGVNQDALRILMTYPNVPDGAVILIAYRQAESTLRTLTSMKEVKEFEFYRERISLLAHELERRLKEVPNPISIGKLREMPMTFKFDNVEQQYSGGEHSYYKFELENGGYAYASGWIYRSVPDEDPPFRRTMASAIQSGDFIFDMSDELRTKIESSFQLAVDGIGSFVDPARMLLKWYHDDVKKRCARFFKAIKRSSLAREIHTKMTQIDSSAKECKAGRVYYWLALQSDGDTRPHASKDAKFFKLFCKALEISDDEADRYWGFIRNARRVNQYIGRELVTRYAEILFQPESAATYRKVPEHVIKQLQQEALRCVYRVENVVPPLARASA